ncbi:5'-methylthioadenosine/S-adenosylhomocysteine nucleosidase [bioreactor metagenome]|uniref:5'-methylthioadenosine/S-adenosylhomocysteine nucleosidase n=2 Tax=root TaxID=1 RepID=A0A645FAR1_9ZZZZ
MGIAAAASLSTKIISKFSPSYLIMAGIAAGVKDKEKNYGDILVARFTWNYESGKYKYNIKTKTTTFEPNPEQIELDDSIVHIINEIKTDKTLLQTIHHGFTVTNNDLKPDANLKVFMGPFASGSAVLADKKKIDSIRRNNRKLIGIDMETFGVFYAAKSFSNNGKTKAISIKSISDFADQKKSDKFRNYAAYTSASFIYNLIRLKLQ